MRAFVIVLTCLALFALGWHAIFQGTELSYLRGGPQITRDIHRAALAIVAGRDGEPVEVRTTGRRVTLVGAVESDAERNLLIEKIAALPMVDAVEDRITVPERVAPFTLTVTKAAEGTVVVSGHTPTRRAEVRLLTEIRDMIRPMVPEGSLELAAGVPEGDWTGMVLAGVAQLDRLDEGRLEIVDTVVRLTGVVADGETEKQIEEFARDAPMGEWEIDVRVPPPPDGFVFEAVLPRAGQVQIEGVVPNDDTVRMLTARLAEKTGRVTKGALGSADGPFNAEWSALVEAAIGALAPLQAGSLEVRGDKVTLKGEVMTDADFARVSPLLEEGWDVLITVLDPTPPGNLRLLLDASDTLTGKGRLPANVSLADLKAALPEIRVSPDDFEEEPGKRVDWKTAFDGLSIVLPRFERATARLLDRSLTLNGQLDRGYSAVGVEAALRAALGPGWTIDVNVEELRPLPGVTIAQRDPGIVVSGVLPMGLAPEKALEQIGADAVGEGLTGGGDGNPDEWSVILSALGDVRPAFAKLNAEISDDKFTLTGRLQPGHTPETIVAWVGDRLTERWMVTVNAPAQTAGEGDVRTPIGSDRQEVFRSGFWLPVVRFPVSPESCDRETTEAMEGKSIGFAEGEDGLKEPDAALFDRLAAIAIRCLNSSSLILEINAHTASVGNDAENRAISERRAAAVAEALTRRGVREDALRPVGRGEDDPISTNNTPEGRAMNVRIAFRWLAADQRSGD